MIAFVEMCLAIFGLYVLLCRAAWAVVIWWAKRIIRKGGR